jgi:hypothetical protein
MSCRAEEARALRVENGTTLEKRPLGVCATGKTPQFMREARAGAAVGE